MAKRRKNIVDDIKEAYEEKDPIKRTLLSSGCTIFDLVTGKFPFGMINIIGDTSTGKTYLTLETLAFLVKQYGNKVKWFWDKAEGRFSWDTKKRYGFDILPPEMEERKSATIEDAAFNLKKELNNLDDDEILIYVVDSLDGLSSSEEIERDEKIYKAKEKGEEVNTGTYGMGKAKGLSGFFRLRMKDISDKNCILIIISQVRENIGVTFGRKYRRNGGKGLDHYADIIAWLAVAEKHKKKGREIGSTIKIKTDKTSNDTPSREGYIELIYDYGIDNVATNINYLFDLKTDSGKDVSGINKKKLDWDGEQFTKSKLIQHIEENNLEEELANRVIQKWEEIEKSISSKGRKSKW
jgi:RecA/RadA recombinase